jgi:hypothetical protein
MADCPDNERHSFGCGTDLVGEEVMSNSQDGANQRPTEVPTGNHTEERRTQVRSNTVLSRIEDMTYEILRKHEKKSA